MIRSLLAGERLRLNDREIRVQFVDPVNPPRIPIYVATGGRQSLRVAAQIADGVIIHNGPNEEMVRRSLEIVQEGAAEVGRDIRDLAIVWWAHTSIGRDWQAVKEHARPKIASKFRQRKSVSLDELGVNLDEDTRRRALEAYNFLDHASAVASHGHVADLIPEPLWREVSLIGTAEEARERVQRIVDRFPEITDVVLNPPVPGFGITYESIMEEFAQAVLTQ